MVDDLPSNDQDRIIAAELCISFRTWQQVLGTFALYPELHTLLSVDSPIKMTIDSDGKSSCILTHTKLDHPIDIPGVSVFRSRTIHSPYQKPDDSNKKIVPLSIIHISHDTLQRHDTIL